MSSIPAGNAVAPTTQLRQLRPGSIPRPPRKPLYDLLLWLVAVLSCLIPLAYLGLVAGLAWLGVHYYLEWAPRSGHGMLRLVGGEIQFGAVAGRQDHRLAHALGAGEVVQGLMQTLGLKRHAFADRERCRMVVQAESIKLHAETESNEKERIITPPRTPKC